MNFNEERYQLLKKAVDAIAEKALEDNIITEDEKQIITIAEDNLQEYARFLHEAQEDNIITNEENAKLHNLEEKLFSETYFTALEDNVLTTDELLLLKTLILTIRPRASIDWLNEDL